MGYKVWLNNHLSSRSVKFFFNGGLVANRNLFNGLPQGSVLSPLLFNLYVKDILFYIQHDCSSLQFADDFVIFSKGKNISEILENLKTSFGNVKRWLSSLGLSLSIKKTQAIIFTRKRNFQMPRNLNVGLDTIEFSSSVKYLGVILDPKLQWSVHINNLKNKTQVYLNVLK